MPKVTYIEHGGTEHAVVVPLGQSVMQGAIRHGVRGIDADCGGACACATCQVYVDPAWLDRIAPASESETSMLEFATHVEPNSRLSCQIKIDESLDGLIVRLPESQQ